MASNSMTSKLMWWSPLLKIETLKTNSLQTPCITLTVISSQSQLSLASFSNSMWRRLITRFWRSITRTTQSNTWMRSTSWMTPCDMKTNRSAQTITLMEIETPMVETTKIPQIIVIVEAIIKIQGIRGQWWTKKRHERLLLRLRDRLRLKSKSLLSNCNS